MSTIYQFKLDIPQIEVEAESLQEAKEKAANKLEHLSSSNDGSEFLANAELEFMSLYYCFHKKTKDSVFNGEKQNRDKTGWLKVTTTYTYCKKCGKLLNEIEVPHYLKKSKSV